MRVAVVEADQEIAKILADFLEGLGHLPVVLRSAEAALAEFGRGHPDCLLLDLHLPGLGALDLLRSRPMRAAETAVVALANGDDEDDARESLRLGAVDVFARPFAFDRLAEVLAYLELGLAVGPEVDVDSRADRRNAARASVARPARVLAFDGSRLDAVTVDVSLGGVKLQCPAPISDGAAVKLALDLDDAARPAEIFAVLLRRDPDGQALAFVNPPGLELARLSRLIDSARVA